MILRGFGGRCLEGFLQAVLGSTTPQKSTLALKPLDSLEPSQQTPQQAQICRLRGCFSSGLLRFCWVVIATADGLVSGIVAGLVIVCLSFLRANDVFDILWFQLWPGS